MRKMKRLLSLVLCLCMVLSLLPGISLPVFAADAVSYIDCSWDGSKVVQTEKTVTEYTVVTASTTTMSNGWYVVTGDVTIGSRITVSGNVHLILSDGTTMTANGGIKVEAGNALTIYGQAADSGKLVANGTQECSAAIGSDGASKGTPPAVGSITINGGVIEANSGKYGGGIGGGSKSSGGTILIQGGTVSAYANVSSDNAGIGSGGTGSSMSGNMGTITILAGKVYGKSSWGAGIGSGAGNKAGGSLTILGGDVTGEVYDARRSDKIGRGYNAGSIGTMIINGTTVAVSGAYTLSVDYIIPEGTTLCIPSGASLTIPNGLTLTNNGTITVEEGGSLINNGVIVQSGVFTNNGTFTCAHSVIADDWTSENGKHYKECLSGCGARLEEECSGGVANCLQAGTCAVCGEEYLSIAPDNHVSEDTYIEYIDDTHHGLYHTCCQALIEKIAHTPAEGQEATCTGVATCAECGFAYGGTDATNHAGELGYIPNGKQTHIQAYICCGTPVGSAESHTVSYTAQEDLTIKGVCETCGDSGSVTLLPSGGTYTGYAITSTYEGDGILGSWNAFAKPTLSYCCEGGCKTVGEHTVTMTLGDQSVSSTFTITPKTLTVSLVQANYKSYDGTPDLTSIYSVLLDGVVVYDEGTYDGAWDDVRDDVKLVRENMVYKVDGVVPGTYTTVDVSGVTITGNDAGNYVIAASFEDVPLQNSSGLTFRIGNEQIWITAHDQLLVGEQEIDQNEYTVEGLDEKFTIEGISLYENSYSQIEIDSYAISIYLDGADVTAYFDIRTYPGNLAWVCEGHEYNENGFCATGECDSYEPAMYTEGLDQWGSTVIYYDIYNAGQLYWFAEQVNTYGNNYINGRLMNDITVNEDLTAENLRQWTPIGSSYPAYCGVFEGNDCTVSGLYVSDPEMDYVGLFGSTDYNFTISNIHLTNSYFEGDSRVGGLFGYAGSTISGCTVSDSVTVKGNSRLGGIVGESASGELNNSYSAAKIVADENAGFCGGLVGYNCLSINNCYTTGSSLVGYNDSGYGGSLANSYYLSEEETDDGGKTAAQFASGEVAYLLQGEQETHIWGQTIGTETYPVLGGEKVYQVTNCAGGTAYSNTDASGQHIDADNSGRCDVCNELMQSAKLCFASVSLKGSIAINYYMLLSDEVIADSTAYMQFTMADGEIVKIPVSEGVATDLNGETYYKYTCAVAAKEMTDIVLSQFYYNGGATTEFSYTVKTYADYIIANSTNANEVALAKAMLNYGAAAQMDFDYNTDDLANADLEAPDYSGVSIEGYTSVSGQGTELATFYSASLILKSETTLRFFFTGSITATYNGQELEVKERNGLYYVDVVGIAAKDLDEDVTITINDGTNTADVTYNPMAYCTVVQNDTTGAADQAMKDLVAALYLYNQAANTYFEEN